MEIKKKRGPYKRKINNQEFACQEDSFSNVRVICGHPHFASAAESGRKKSSQKTDAEPVALTGSGQQLLISNSRCGDEPDCVIEDRYSAAADEGSDGFVSIHHTDDHEFEEITIEINHDMNFQEKKTELHEFLTKQLSQEIKTDNDAIADEIWKLTLEDEQERMEEP